MRRWFDFDGDALDSRRTICVGVDVFELDTAADAEELEIRADHDFTACAITDARLHGGAESLDMQPHARSPDDLRRIRFRLFVDRFLLGDGVADNVLKRVEAVLVHFQEPDAEVPAVAVFVSPRDFAMYDDFGSASFEPTDQGFADLRKVCGLQMHPCRRHIDRLRFEGSRSTLSGPNLHQRVKGDPRTTRATLILHAHA